MLQGICKVDMDLLIESVQPLLTKVKTGESDVDLDQLRSVLMTAPNSA